MERTVRGKRENGVPCLLALLFFFFFFFALLSLTDRAEQTANQQPEQPATYIKNVIKRSGKLSFFLKEEKLT